jgi:hypothetical protein
VPRRNRFSSHVAVVLAITFATGLAYVARFAPPSAYPAYSSLHSGPRGTKLLFEALAATGKFQVSRDYLTPGEAKLQNAAVFYLGVMPDSLATAEDKALDKLEQIARAGNRLILGIDGQRFKTKQRRGRIEKRWGVRVRQDYEIVFEDGNSWRVLPDSGAFVRPFGAGAIVLVLHAERLTNEVLAGDVTARAPVLALITGRNRIVFEEAHLGIVETGSIAGLARRYRLQGLMAGLLLVAIVFAWNRSWAFPPPSRFEEEAGVMIVASDSRTMFTEMLSRHIGPESLIDVCVSEWNRIHSDTTKLEGRVAPLAGESACARYRKIQEQMKCKKIVQS